MKVGIVGYGCYIPEQRITVEEIARVWNRDPREVKEGLLIEEKSVPNHDEDTITISMEAARNALARARIEPKEIGALYVGSESHPYAVKPSGTVISEALGTGNNINIVDTEFACKAGTTCLYLCMAQVKADFIKYGLAIGADCAQSQPGDALEYTAAAGAGAFVIGKDPLAELEAFNFHTTDTSDFWRRSGEDYPSHGARFTGKPAYFKHVVSATKGLLEKSGLQPKDFDYAVFHMPNGKFPVTASKILGFDMKQLEPGLLVKKIGNCYAGSSLLGLCAVLDIAKPGQRVLITSYGSGAGSDSFSFVVTDKILESRDLAPKTEEYVRKKKYIDYGTYVKLRGKLKF